MTRFAHLFAPAALSTAAAALVFLAPSVARAQTYDVTTDFSFTNNPNGVWTYTSSATLGGATSLLDVPFGDPGDVRGWNSSIFGSLPTVLRNDSAGETFTVPVGGVGVHPGSDGSGGDFVIIRFTAPQTSTYSVNAQFLAGDFGNIDAYILRNSFTGVPVFADLATPSDSFFNGSVSLTAGDTLDFVVGTGDDDFYGDTTPVGVTITRTGSAVGAPEPGSLALVLPGMALMGGVIARRRRKTA